jgi:ankyrin repeat protein
MEPRLFAIHGTNDVFSLYQVSFTKRPGDNWTILPHDENAVGRDLIGHKCRELQDYFEAWQGRLNRPDRQNIGGFFGLTTITSPPKYPKLNAGTTSVFLGIFLKAVREFKGRRFKDEWASVTVTGDIEYINGNLQLKAAGAVKSKFNEEFSEYAKTNPGKHLFLYIDENSSPETYFEPQEERENIQVRRFSTDDPAYDILDFVFEPFDREELPSYFNDEQKRFFKRFNNFNKYAGKDQPQLDVFIETAGYRSMRKTALTSSSFNGFFIWGAGGRGKTALAEQLARDMIQEGNAYAALWMKVSTDTVSKNYLHPESVHILEHYIESALCDFLGIPETNRGLLFDTLSQHPWLIIFDDLEIQGMLLDTFLAAVEIFLLKIQGCRPYLLFTSRSKNEKIGINNRLIQDIEVPAFTEKETERFFRAAAERQTYYEEKIGRFENLPLYSGFIKNLHREWGAFPLLILQICRFLKKETVDIPFLNRLFEGLDYINEKDIQKKIIALYKGIFRGHTENSQKLLLFMLNFGPQIESSQDEIEQKIRELRADISLPLNDSLNELGQSLLIYSVNREEGIRYGIKGMEYMALLFGEDFSCNGLREDFLDPCFLLDRMLEYDRPKREIERVLPLLKKRRIDIKTQAEREWTTLAIAVRYSTDPDVIRLLLENGWEAGSCNKDGLTPVHIAAWNNSPIETMEVLLEYGADINEKDSHSGRTPLHVAFLKEADPRLVEFMLSQGAKINEKDSPSQQTPLHVAVIHIRDPEIFRILRRHHADFLAPDRDGSLPLHWGAAFNSVKEIIDQLSEGIDINITENDRQTPLHFASMHNHEPEIVEHLIEKGANIHARTETGVEPIHDAAAWTGTPEIIDVLIKNGANIEARTDHGSTPLHLAVYFNDNKAIHKKLIEYGANIQSRDKKGRLPLHCTARNTNHNAVAYLIEEGSDINARDYEGSTPLHAAAKNSNPLIVRALLEGGASVNAVDHSGLTPLLVAAGNPETVVIRTLLDYGADVQARDINGATFLHIAVMFNKNPNVLRLALKKGAAIDAKDDKGMTPLQFAVLSHEPHGPELLEIVKLLLDHGADIYAKNNDGWSAADKIFDVDRAIGKILFRKKITGGFRKKQNNRKKRIPRFKLTKFLKKQALFFHCLRANSNDHIDKAFEYVTEGIELFPEEADFWIMKGNILHNFEEYEEAARCYDKAEKYGMDPVSALNSKARCAIKITDYEKAYRYYDNALKINPDSAETWYNLGYILNISGNFKEAFKCLSRAVNLDPSNKKYREFKEFFQKTIQIVYYDKFLP